jgi:hypothetical protein
MSHGTRIAAAVCCNIWILFMSALDGRGPVPRVYELRADVLAQRGIFREDALPHHDAGSCGGLRRPARQSEVMRRYYQQAHAFYCGVDLHARTM